MKILGSVLGAHLLKIYNGLGHKEGKFEKFYIRAGKTRGQWINMGWGVCRLQFPFHAACISPPHHFLITRFL
jgi:hypothetical protein